MEIRIKCKGYKDKGKTYKIKTNSGAVITGSDNKRNLSDQNSKSKLERFKIL